MAEIDHLNEKSSDFDETCYTNANLELYNSHVIKYNFSKIQDGGRLQF